MTIEHPIEDEVTQLARRVSKARGRLAYQFDPALTEALSEDELNAERSLAERIREQDREQRWKQAQAGAAASDRARQTTEQIEKADIRDLLLARTAIAAQRRESSPHAKLASLYRHRALSLRALAAVVVAGMLWSAVNVQHNIAPGGPNDPLYWFSYLLEGMISVCLIIIMTGTSKVAEWGVVDSRHQVVLAEVALLALTVTLNTYPYLRTSRWYDAAVHAVAPVMIGVALLIHDAASVRYGLAITRATDQVRDLPDPAEQIRRTLPVMASYRLGVPADMTTSGGIPDQLAGVEQHQLEAAAEIHPIPDVEAIAHVDNQVATPAVAKKVVRNGAAVRPDGSSAVPASAENHDAPGTPEPLPVVPAHTSGPTATDAAMSAELQSLGTPATALDRHVGPAEAENDSASTDAVNPFAAKVDEALQSVFVTDVHSTGQFRVAETLEQELAELQAARRRARTGKEL